MLTASKANGQVPQRFLLKQIWCWREQCPSKLFKKSEWGGFMRKRCSHREDERFAFLLPWFSHAAYPSLGTKPAGGQVAIRTRENRWARQGTTPRAQPKVPLMEPRSKQNTPVGVEGRLMPTFGRACWQSGLKARFWDAGNVLYIDWVVLHKHKQ